MADDRLKKKKKKKKRNRNQGRKQRTLALLFCSNRTLSSLKEQKY